MVSKFFPGIKNYNKGITLVEVIVVVFIVALFSTILISDFPKIRRQFALSRATYKLTQDFRKALDMGLSGEFKTNATGYGVFIDLTEGENTKYIIYADIDDGNGGDQQYTLTQDEVLEIIDLKVEEKGVIIKLINNTLSQQVSVNFRPPNPDIYISNLQPNTDSVEINLGLEVDLAGTPRIISVNRAGLIEIK
jgi:type II secretory pathway pseudopilin PulG